MDWDLWLRLAAVGAVVQIETNLASYRWLGSNKTAAGGLARLAEVEAVARRHGCPGLPAYFRLELARHQAGAARRLLGEGQLLGGCGAFWHAALAIGTSWRALASLCTPHVWRNYRTAQRLYRQAAKFEQ
jgi:hypothetical protein